MLPNPRIQAEVKLHPDVQSLDDEWSGITDPVIRRKLQNRLNQRAARRRKVEKLGQGSAAPVATVVGSVASTINKSEPQRPLVHVPKVNVTDLIALRANALHRAGLLHRWSSKRSSQPAFSSLRHQSQCQIRYSEQLQGRLDQVKGLAQRLQHERENAWAYPLPADHLISLIYYNVYRALIHNVELLGLDQDLMYTDDYPSPFTPMSPSATSAIRYLPPSLQPTELQKSIAHHAQWDIVPDPVVRDNVLRYGEENIDDVELCLDMVGCGELISSTNGDVQANSGLLIWGEPWDIYGWELTESFCRKWGWMVRNSAILESTNRWRRARDELELDFDRILNVD